MQKNAKSSKINANAKKMQKIAYVLKKCKKNAKSSKINTKKCKKNKKCKSKII